MDEGNGDRQSAKVVLYTLGGCGACSLARRILRHRGIDFEEPRGDGAPGFRRALRERTGRATVPQVVIDANRSAVLTRSPCSTGVELLAARVRREPFPIAVVRRRSLPIRLLASTLSTLGGEGLGPWRYRVDLVERNGGVLARGRAGSRAEATAIAAALRAEFEAELASD